MAYEDALMQLEALGNQQFKKKKKKKATPAPKQTKPKTDPLAGIGTKKKQTTLLRMSDTFVPKDILVADKPLIKLNKPTKREVPNGEVLASTRLQDQFAVSKPIAKKDIKFTPDELKTANIRPEFAQKYPIMAKAMVKVSQPIEKFEQTTTPGKFMKRMGLTAAELKTGSSAGTYGKRPTTGNKVVDTIADLVGTAAGFMRGGLGEPNIAGLSMVPSRTLITGMKTARGFTPEVVAQMPRVDRALAKAGTAIGNLGRLEKPAERAISGLTGGAVFGGLQGMAEGGNIGEVAKSAGEEALIFGAMEVGLPYIGEALKKVARPVGIRIKGALAGKKIQPLEDFTVIRSKSPDRLISEGYEEFRPNSGIWVKRDPQTGVLLDQYYETVVSGDRIVPKYELWREGQRGTKRAPQSVDDVVVVDDAIVTPARTEVKEPTVVRQPERVAMAPETEPPRIVPQETEPPKVEPADRRMNLVLREEVEKLSPEEKDEVIRELRNRVFTDELTGLRNRTAYLADEKQPYQAIIDLDNLKWVNDNVSHEAGDTLLKTFAESLPEGSYRISGDEFVIQGTKKELDRLLPELESKLSKQAVQLGDVSKEGIGFSYGTGETIEEAEVALQRHKAARLKEGKRVERGEQPPGVSKPKPVKVETIDTKEPIKPLDGIGKEDVVAFSGQRQMKPRVTKEKILLTPNYIDDEHLEKVKTKMKDYGSPEIDVVQIREGVYIALEGSHRIRAASELKIPVHYNVIDPNKEYKADDIAGWEEGMTAGELAEIMYLNGTSEEFDITNEIPLLTRDRHGEVVAEEIVDVDLREPVKPLSGIGEELSLRVDRNTPDMGEALGLMQGIPSKPKAKRTTGHTFTDPEVEARFQNAHGVPKAKTTEKVKAFLDAFKRKATRDYEWLPRGAKYSQLRFSLTNLQKQKSIQSDITLRNIQSITAGLEGERYRLFEKKVIFDDLLEEAKAGHELPFGLTSQEEVERELKHIERYLDDGIREAVDVRSRTWKEIVENYSQAMKDIGFNVEDRFTKENYYRHQIIQYANIKGIKGTGKKLSTPTGRGFLKKREGSSFDINSNYLQAEWEVMAQMLYDTEVAKVIKMVEDEYSIKLKDEDIIPDGYVKWQPREGNVFFMGDTIPAKIVDAITNKGLAEITGEDLKKVLIVGGKHKELIIPEEVALTLENMLKDRHMGDIAKVSSFVMGKWKQWQLISPRRMPKHNIRNLTGDMDAVFVGNPSAFKKIPQAMRELYPVFYGDKSMTPEMKEWFKRGGMQSLLQAQEMGDLNELRMFVKKFEGKGKSLPAKVWEGYWTKARLTTDFRESILRFAAYLDYLEQMLGNNGKPKNFGASRPDEVMALKDVRDRAYKLSNDLLGAYDEISELGKEIREHLFPFWSWKEANFRRYSQFIKNAINGDKEMAIRMGKRMGAKAPLVAFRLGKFVVAATAFSVMLEVYNHLMFPELVDKVSDYVKERPHIILGTDKDGNVQYFTNMGALGDFLEWFGLDSASQMTRDYLSGKKSIKEIATEMAKKPVNILAQSVRPEVKTFLEVSTGTTIFPDVFEPVKTRDRWRQLFNNFGLENEYDALTGKPMRGGYKKSIEEVFVYKSDPAETAYNNARSAKYDYLKKIGKGSGYGDINPKSNALYYLKLAIRYNDLDAAKKYLDEYIRLGGTKKGLKQSIATMHPLYGLSKDERVKYVKSLSRDEKKELKQAIEYYEEVFLGEKAE